MLVLHLFCTLRIAGLLIINRDGCIASCSLALLQLQPKSASFPIISTAASSFKVQNQTEIINVATVTIVRVKKGIKEFVNLSIGINSITDSL